MVKELRQGLRGNTADYVLGTLEGWGAFSVVRWHAVEEISRPFAYEIFLLRRQAAGEVDLDGLLDSGATLRVASEERWRPVHGIVAEVEMLDQTPEFFVYRVLLVPHLWRALHRQRCRTFVDKSVKEVVTAVLENRAAPQLDGTGGLRELAEPPPAPPAEPNFGEFVEPDAGHRWVIEEPLSLTAPRPMLVQYNESDLDFVARLLEAEGASYFFEHGEHTLVMTITDRPGQAPLRASDVAHDLFRGAVGGTSRDQELVRSLHESRRLRPRGVRCRDYSWRRSTTVIEAAAESRLPGARDLEHYEYRVALPTTSTDLPAQWRAERFDDEGLLAHGTATVRTLEPGQRFTLRDREGSRDDAEYLLVRVETVASELGPEGTILDQIPFGLPGRPRPETPSFACRFEVLPASRRFRPARSTPKPLIQGVDTARVTAEEVAATAPPPELHSDDQGRVRVRFHWDQREADGTPSSCWLRVSHAWAGSGFGALYVPRVGHEVLVAYERGDPDRPVVVGRVYNVQNPPPYDATNTTKSTLKSDSVGTDGSSAEGFNELRFEDAAGAEQIFLHAQRNLDEVVLASHSTSVGGDQSNTVGGDQSNRVHGSRTHHVTGTELVTVDGNRTTEFNSNENKRVASALTTSVGTNESRSVGANRATTIGATDSLQVSTRTTLVKGAESRQVGGADALDAGSRSTHVRGLHVVTNGTSYISSAAAAHQFDSPVFEVSSATVTIKAGAASLHMESGLILLNNGAGACVSLVGGLAEVLASGTVLASGGGGAVLKGGGVDIQGDGTVNITGGVINGQAGAIKLNG